MPPKGNKAIKTLEMPNEAKDTVQKFLYFAAGLPNTDSLYESLLKGLMSDENLHADFPEHTFTKYSVCIPCENPLRVLIDYDVYEMDSDGEELEEPSTKLDFRLLYGGECIAQKVTNTCPDCFKAGLFFIKEKHLCGAVNNQPASKMRV